MKNEENLMKIATETSVSEANVSDDISHLRDYYAGTDDSLVESLNESLNALNSLDALLKALEMTVEDLAEMCGEEEDSDPK